MIASPPSPLFSPWHWLLLNGILLGLLLGMRPASSFDRQPYRSFEVVKPPYDGGRMSAIGVVVRKDGIAFLASWPGIHIFDGERWDLLEHPQRQRGSAITIDAQERVYVGFHNDFGLVEYSPNGEASFKSLRNDCVGENVQTGRCFFAFADEEQVYFGCDAGLAVWKKQPHTPQGKFVEFGTAKAESYSAVHGRIIAAVNDPAEQKVELLRLEKDHFVTYLSHEETVNSPSFLESFRIGGCEFDSETMLFASYAGGFFFVRDGKLQEFDSQISALAKKTRVKGVQRIDGNTWLMCAESGFTFFDREGRILDHTDNSKESGLGVCLNQGFVDHEYTLWIPTRGAGVAVKVDLSTIVRRRRSRSEKVEWVKNFAGEFWMSHAGQVLKIPDLRTVLADSRQSTPIEIVTEQSLDSIVTENALLIGSINGLRIVLPEGTVETLAEDTYFTTGVVFQNERFAAFCTFGAGIQRFHRVGSAWESVGPITGSPHDSFAIAHDPRRNCLWYSFLHSSGQWQIARLKLAGYDFLSDATPEYEHYSAFSFQGDKNIVVWNGRVLFNAIDGLVEYNDLTNQFEPTGFTYDIQTGSHGNTIGAIAVDAVGRLWLGVTPSQVYRIDQTGRVDMPTGLRASDNIRRIVPSEDGGKVWLLNTESEVIELECQQAHPPLEISTRITQVSVNGSPVPFNSGATQKFPSRSGPIQLQYSAQSAYLHPSARYQYRLLGMESRWSPWTSDAYQIFQALPQGEYEFQVRVRSRDFSLGKPATFSFQVLPPWYSTWWAIAMYTVASLAFLRGGILWQTHVQRKRLQQLEVIVGERTEALAKSQQLLETRVKDRTSQLQEANLQLSSEIDRRREIEAQLQESETRYRSIVDDQQEAIVRFDSYGNIEFANASFMRANHCTPESLSNANIFDFIHPDDLARATQLFQNTTSEGLTTVAERLKVIRPDGKVEWEEWNGRTIYNAAGKFLCFQAASRNVTELVKAEDLIHEKETALRHVSRLSMLGEMVASITHEIHQPLGSISNFAFAVAKTLESQTDETAANIIRWNTQIVQQIKRAEEITRRLRGFARRSDAERLRLSVNVIVKDSLAMLEYDRRHAMVDVELNLGDSLPDLELDRVQIEQVLVNLIRNAYDAMSTTTQVKRQLVIKTEMIGKDIAVSVRDNGPGIEQDKLELIFQPFYTGKANGLGLGLAISRSIIEDADGRIWAENVNPGLCMQFTLPVR